MSRTPKPGAPVRGSRSGRPIMVLLDLLGRRWTLRILWELRAAPLTFRDLQTACGGISPSVVNTRLDELIDAGIVERSQGDGYALTAEGRHLSPTLLDLNQWAERWATSFLARAAGEVARAKRVTEGGRQARVDGPPSTSLRSATSPAKSGGRKI